MDELYHGETIYLSQIKKSYNRNQQREERPLIKRMALHASDLCFLDQDNNPVSIQAPYPKDFEVLIRQLRKYDQL
jgi:23S rRNA pseudouridine955/2504/2580 synthase